MRVAFSQQVAEGQSAPNFAIYRAFYRAFYRTFHRARIDAWSNNGSCGPRPQHDAGLCNATGGIFNVFTVHLSAGLFSACGYEPNDQQRR
jgi:hypothetical protein